MKPESNFILADEIRSMADGKPMAIGLFPDHVVVFPLPREFFDERAAGKKPAIAVDLAALVCLMGLEPGHYEGKVILRMPDGAVNSQSDSPTSIQVEESKSVNLIFNMKGLILTDDGTYGLQVALDGCETVEHRFVVRFAQR